MSCRVPLVEPGSRPELAPIEPSIPAQRGRISELYRVLLNSGPLASGWEGMLTAVRNKSSVPADLRELMILRVAVLNRAQYEFDAVCRMRKRPAPPTPSLPPCARLAFHPCSTMTKSSCSNSPMR